MHPSEVLFQGKRKPVSLPACDHYAGSEKLMRKSLALQQELGSIFDLTFDCENAAAGNEKAHAKLAAALIASGENRFDRIGARVHPPHSPFFEQDVALLCESTAKKFAYLIVPKIESVADAEQACDIVAAFSPTDEDIDDALHILNEAQRTGWGPISHDGKLHDRASYRYYWMALQRAKASGLPLPENAAALMETN